MATGKRSLQFSSAQIGAWEIRDRNDTNVYVAEKYLFGTPGNFFIDAIIRNIYY